MNKWRGDVAATFDTWAIAVTGPAAGTGTLAVYIPTLAFGKRVLVDFVNAETAATVAARLADALANSSIPEFLEFTWTVNAANITATAKVAGWPSTLFVDVTGPGIGHVDTHPVIATGPNFVDNPKNWTRGVLPGTGGAEDVEAREGPAMLFGLDGMYAGSCTSTRFFASFTAGFGLPVRNTSVNGDYSEFRQRDLKLTQGGDIHIGEGEGGGMARGVGKVGANKVYIHMTANAADAGLPAVDLGGDGTGADPLVFSVFNGSAGWCGSLLATGSIPVAVSIVNGELLINAEIDDINVRGGIVVNRANVDDIYLQGGEYRQDDGVITGPITADGGIVRLNHAQAGTFVVVMRGSVGGDVPVLDLSGNDRTARDLAAGSSFTGGAYILDPFKTAVLTAVRFDKQSLLASDLSPYLLVTRA